MRITEVTLRKIISDYVYKRPQFRQEMVWTSDFAEAITLSLESKPFSQESVGYKLQDEQSCGSKTNDSRDS